jgi:hypothetical protein
MMILPAFFEVNSLANINDAISGSYSIDRANSREEG